MSNNRFVMDSRVPISPSASIDDPSHPENVTKRAIMLERQAHADGEYDIKVPIRQGFANPSPLPSATSLPSLLLLFVSLLVGNALVGIAVCYKMNMLYRVLLAVGAMCAFRYAASHVLCELPSEIIK